MWGRFTKSGLQLESVLQEPHMQDMGFSCRIPCVKPLLNNRQRQKRLAWAEDKKDWTAAEWSKVMFSDERSQSLEEERRGTESTLLEVQCKVSTVSDGLWCHVICWCWSTLFTEVQGQRSCIPKGVPTKY
ncbi:Transposable element Tcb2 transposase [Labeo rohita]|uniref:Transposable element Tcb2 transposase n=1 Tax=Labeo rohita TaxID=84645 RepID=A0ABQ8LBF3_LABRO|nr:Transposable element Tcb2 transposase [Labeo rohita]